MAFRKREPKFKRQDLKEDYLPEEDEIIGEEVEEEEEEEIEVPKPMYRKPIQQPPTEKVEPKKVQRQSAEEEPVWRMEELPTQTSPVIYNSKQKKFYTLYDAIAEILNRTEE